MAYITDDLHILQAYSDKMVSVLCLARNQFFTVGVVTFVLMILRQGHLIMLKYSQSFMFLLIEFQTVLIMETKSPTRK